MKHNPIIHADGSEEQRPRTREEIAALEEANRIAARSNLRGTGDRRNHGMPSGHPDGCRRIVERRKVLSDFERDMLLQEAPHDAH